MMPDVAIPKFQPVMLPMLETLADGHLRRVVPDVTDVLAVRFGLTTDEVEQMLPSGAMPTFENRCRWAAWYMVKAGVLESPKRGHVAITQRGLALLATKPEKVDVGVLSQYPEFEEFRKSKSTDTPSHAEASPRRR